MDITGVTQADMIDGWISGCRRVESPNCNERPDVHDVSLLVIHSISLPPAEYGGPYIDQLFTNSLDPHAHPYFAGIAGLTVSAHLLIDRKGVVTQYVPLHRRAWHAGKSFFDGRENCNDFSIGIELEGTDTDVFTDAQYAALASLSCLIMQHYPAITPARIAAHSTIAPGRKTDPGAGFDWARYRALLG